MPRSPHEREDARRETPGGMEASDRRYVGAPALQSRRSAGARLPPVIAWHPQTASLTGGQVVTEHCGATHLVWEQQPLDSEVWAAITSAVTVRLKDVAGNDVTTAGVGVTIALASGTGPLSGTLTRSRDAALPACPLAVGERRGRRVRPRAVLPGHRGQPGGVREAAGPGLRSDAVRAMIRLRCPGNDHRARPLALAV